MSEVDTACDQLFHTFLSDTAVGQVDVLQLLTAIAAPQKNGRMEGGRRREGKGGKHSERRRKNKGRERRKDGQGVKGEEERIGREMITKENGREGRKKKEWAGR